MYVALSIVVIDMIDRIGDRVKNMFLQLAFFVLAIVGYSYLVDHLSTLQDRDALREALRNDTCVTTDRIVDKPVLEKIGGEYLITTSTEQTFEYQCASGNQYLTKPNLEH